MYYGVCERASHGPRPSHSIDLSHPLRITAVAAQARSSPWDSLSACMHAFANLSSYGPIWRRCTCKSSHAPTQTACLTAPSSRDVERDSENALSGVRASGPLTGRRTPRIAALGSLWLAQVLEAALRRLPVPSLVPAFRFGPITVCLCQLRPTSLLFPTSTSTSSASSTHTFWPCYPRCQQPSYGDS